MNTTTTKNGKRQKPILAGGGQGPGSMQPKPQQDAARGLAQAAQGMPVEEQNQKSDRPDGKEQNGGKSASGGLDSTGGGPDLAITADSIYWTVQRAPTSDETRERFELGPKQVETPHSRLTVLQFPTVKQLMTHLRTISEYWNPRLFSMGERLVRVQIFENGLNLVMFPSYAAAVADDQAREKFAKQSKSPVNEVKPCPFCRRFDQLEIIRMIKERRDGTEFDGEVVKCHRCEAEARLDLWQRFPVTLAAGVSQDCSFEK